MLIQVAVEEFADITEVATTVEDTEIGTNSIIFWPETIYVLSSR